ncbi:MAG: hypothetical protein ACRCUC_00925, partial [Aestuariivirga sp.]
QTFMVVLDDATDRTRVIAALRDQEIESNLGAQSLSAIGIYGEQPDIAVVGPRLYRQGLALPLCEKMSRDDVGRVCQALSTVLDAQGAAPGVGSRVSA